MEDGKYLVPRQVVVQAEILPGAGPAEMGLLAAGVGLGLLVQWGAAVVMEAVHIPTVPVLIVRVALTVLLGGGAWVVTRPAQGGRVMDYVLALVRYMRAGNAPHLYGPPEGGRRG